MGQSKMRGTLSFLCSLIYKFTLFIRVCLALPVSQLIWTPVDLDPRSISTSRYGPPGPNLLADMDPRGYKSTSKYGPPLADLDPPSKVKQSKQNAYN